MTEKQKDAAAKDFCLRASAQGTAELLARECAEAIADSDVIDVSVVLEIINETIPIVELLNVAEASKELYDELARLFPHKVGDRVMTNWRTNITALRAKLPKGAL